MTSVCEDPGRQERWGGISHRRDGPVEGAPTESLGIWSNQPWEFHGNLRWFKPEKWGWNSETRDNQRKKGDIQQWRMELVVSKIARKEWKWYATMESFRNRDSSLTKCGCFWCLALWMQWQTCWFYVISTYRLVQFNEENKEVYWILTKLRLVDWDVPLQIGVHLNRRENCIDRCPMTFGQHVKLVPGGARWLSKLSSKLLSSQTSPYFVASPKQHEIPSPSKFKRISLFYICSIPFRALLFFTLWWTNIAMENHHS